MKSWKEGQMRALACVLMAVAFSWFLASHAIAQTTFGSIYGTVNDQSAAVIQGAVVTATNTQTGETHTTQSNDSGNYIRL